MTYRDDRPKCPKCGKPATVYVFLWDFHQCDAGHQWDGPVNGGPEVSARQRYG